MKAYTTAELNYILSKHKLWLKCDPSGVRANLSCADLSGVNLSYADLREDLSKSYIAELEIPSDAMRCSGTEANGDVAYSKYDLGFKYRVGEIVNVDNFDTNRWNECAPGIHFLITRKEAVNYFN